MRLRGLKAKTFLIGVLGMAGLYVAVHSAAGEEFQARLLGKDTHSTGVGATKFIISIDSYTKAEEVYDLAKILAEQGYDAFMSAFQVINKGFVRPTTGRGVKVNIHAAHSIPTEKGRKITLFTQRQSWDTEAQQRTDHRFTFMVIELNLDKKGNGDGKIYEQASIRISGQGMIEMESYNTPPLQLWGVSPRK